MSDDIYLEQPPPVKVRPAGLGSLGSDSYIEEPFTIRSPHRVHIGSDVMIGARSLLSLVEEYNGKRHEPLLVVGDGTEIGRDFYVACVGEIHIGARVGISARVFIGDSARDYGDPAQEYVDMPIDDPAPVRIGDGVVIGIGALILPGVTVGERACVAGGSVVTRDVPPRCLVFGNPARIVRSWDQESEKWIAGPPRRDT